MANNKQNSQFSLNSTPSAITLSLEEVEYIKKNLNKNNNK